MEIGTNPTWRPLGAGPKAGLEIELVHSEGYAATRHLRNLTPDFERDAGYLAAAKADGSVNGVEFVTQPASLAIHRRNLPRVLRHLRALGFSANATCGLHIHINRRAGQLNSGLVAMKLAAIANLDSTPWNNLFRRVSGRIGRNWARTIAVRPDGSLFVAVQQVGTHTATLNSEKFLRVNMLHPSSWEFRQGHGTAFASRALLRIEAALALVRFVNGVSLDKLDALGGADAEVARFLAWVCEHDGDYPRFAALSADIIHITPEALDL